MTTPTLWTTADFDAMNWHDAHVHALRIVHGAHGSGELILDIDYILEWHTGEALYSFVVVQATLQFHEVHSLVMNLDYATPQAGFGAFSIDGITREPFTDARGFTAVRWRLEVNWPDGEIEFIATGFTQTRVGEPVTQMRQSLPAASRQGDCG